MKQRFLKIIAVLLVAVLLVGCSGTEERVITRFSEMEYTRPDVSLVEDALAACEQSVADEEPLEDLEEKIVTFIDLYNSYYTQYCLANIHYSKDTTDEYWTEENNFCVENTAVVDAALDQLYYLLADSIHREALEGEDYFGEDFFDDYEGDSLWDDTFTALMEKEAELTNRYYELSGLEMDDENILALAELYAEMILLRMDIAEYAGFDSYAEFAYDFYYARDYTPEQERILLADIQEELVPVYRRLLTEGLSGIYVERATEEETFHFVKKLASRIGGTVWDAFLLLEEAELYDISVGKNKYGASFEMYLSDYDEPYIFLDPQGSTYDFLTFTHEFGHFCNDYASEGSPVGIDVAEVFSQGLEYLSLCIFEDLGPMAKLKMVDSLCVYVEQSAYASFEQRAYSLPREEVTAENLFALYEQVGTEYGFDAWGFNNWDFVQIPHIFTNPMYVFSYVVSNDAAMQIYRLELEEPGAGIQLYCENLDTEEEYFLAFLDSAGLESPFERGYMKSVRTTLEDILFG